MFKRYGMAVTIALFFWAVLLAPWFRGQTIQAVTDVAAHLGQWDPGTTFPLRTWTAEGWARTPGMAPAAKQHNPHLGSIRPTYRLMNVPSERQLESIAKTRAFMDALGLPVMNEPGVTTTLQPVRVPNRYTLTVNSAPSQWSWGAYGAHRWKKATYTICAAPIAGKPAGPRLGLSQRLSAFPIEHTPWGFRRLGLPVVGVMVVEKGDWKLIRRGVAVVGGLDTYQARGEFPLQGTASYAVQLFLVLSDPGQQDYAVWSRVGVLEATGG